MKRTAVIPIVNEVVITIKGVKYQNQTITMDVYCDVKSKQGTQAVCDEPYFIAGSSFWEKQFGKTQERAIQQICKRGIEAFLKANPEDDESPEKEKNPVKLKMV